MTSSTKSLPYDIDSFQEEMHGFKVLQMPERRSITFSVYTLSYPPNIRIYPTLANSKIFFFDNEFNSLYFLDKLQFVNDCKRLIIVPCIGYNVYKLNKITVHLSDRELFWNSENPNSVDKIKSPMGTYVANSLICLK